MKKPSTIWRKPGVTSERLREVFYDPNALGGYDANHSTSEERFSIIGLSSRRLLYVVYAERHDDLVRIISARRAVKSEQEIYERRAT